MRFISPSFLSLTLLMAFLPWVEVRCEQRNAGPFRLSRAVVEQDAFQIAMGTVHFNSVPNMGQRIPNQGPGGLPQLQNQQTDTPPAPLIWAVLGCTLLGAIVGFAVPARKPRLIIMLLATLGAGGALLAQCLLGFPLIKQATPDWIQQFMDRIGVLDPEIRGPEVGFTAGFTSTFQIAIFGLAGGIIGVLVDFLNPPKRRRDEDLEDEDDRPRRRQRLRDDDEDDLPPRRRPPPRDDDDDDDRGRRGGDRLRR